MIAKSKNSPARMRTLPFLGLWTAFHIGAWLFTLWLWEALRISYTDYELNALFVALVPGMTAVAGQWLVMTHGLKKSVKPWLPVSFAGYLLSAAAYYQYLTGSQPLSEAPGVMLTILFVPAAAVQALWLHSRVKSAWLWVVGAAVSAVLFALPVQQSANINQQYLFLAMAAIMQGVVSGSVMRHLWTQEREKDKNTKVKTDALDDRSEQAHARLDAPDEPDNRLEYEPDVPRKYTSDGKTAS